MRLFGVINANPDSAHAESMVETPAAALARARALLAAGADAIDVGGQGSTDLAAVVDWRVEWERLETIVPALLALGVEVSVDTWRPEVAARSLTAGATVINAANGMQDDAMWRIAADHGARVVVPFLSGPDPRSMAPVGGDPIPAIAEFFDARLADADRFGMREHCILDPGTGFAPPNPDPAERYRYQREVFGRLGELRRFGLPLYVALPWRRTPREDELLELAVSARPDYGRCHHPDRVRSVEAAVLAGQE